MKKNLLLLYLLLFYGLTSFNQTLYTSTDLAGYRANPGLNGLGTPKIFFDDVNILSSQLAGSDSVSFTKLKFGILRAANAPATTVNVYYTIADDTSDYDKFIKIPPVQIGTVDLPANGAAASGVLITLGDSVTQIFAVKTDTNNVYNGYQTIFLGLGFSNNSGLNGWALTIPGAPDGENDNVFWLYNPDSSVNRFATYFGDPPDNPAATFYIEAFGKGVTNPLPVTLTNFNARRSGKINQLSWTTEQELNAHHFSIERSNDARNFISIGQATGSSSNLHNYAFTDAHPVKGNNYYRLRTVDKDNSAKISPTRNVRNIGLADIHIYPNPVINKLSVEITADKAAKGQVTITDVSGKAVYTNSIQLPAGTFILPVTVNNMAAGSYVMKIQLEDDVIIKKFNKQ